MKTLAQFEGAQFLKRCNRIRKDVQAFLNETKILKIRENMPVFTGEETPDQKKEMLRVQSVKNINAMIDKALEEYPEKTMELFSLFVEVEENEPTPSGMDIVMAGMNVLFDNRVMDFLLSLIRLGQMNTYD